jgi:hypothetical protein
VNTWLPVPVPAIVPQPPQITLYGSAIRPKDVAEQALSDVTPDQVAGLPPELRQELAALKGDAWTRGITWAPENRYPAEVRAGCDYSTVDLPALPAPAGLALVQGAGGTLANATYKYQVTAIDANGETTPCALVTVVVAGGGGTASVGLSWDVEADIQYKVYGRVSGSIGLLATVGPFDPEGTGPTYMDTGAASVGAAPPSSNTTGGPGTYTNQPVQVAVPYVLVSEDWCSTFGFEARDFKGRATRLLENGFHAGLEREFWAGAMAQAQGWPNNYLTNTATVTDLTPGTVPSVARAQQILQDAIAQNGYGGQGMIHCQPQTAPNLLNARRVGSLLLDVFDNIVVPGVGYPGTVPGGDAPPSGQSCLYATDLIAVRLEEDVTIFPDTFAEATDWGQAGEPNTIRFRGMKFGLAYGDFQIHYACRATLES